MTVGRHGKAAYAVTDGRSDLLEALARRMASRGALAGVTAAALQPLPSKGLVHDHIRVRGFEIEGCRLLLRVPRLNQWGLSAEDGLAYEAAAFARAEPSGHTPRLFDRIAPDDVLPFGALLVEEIAGRPPQLPTEMSAVAETLAAVHGLALPDADARLPLFSHEDAVAGTLARIEEQAPFVDEVAASADARAAIAAELDWARHFAQDIAGAAGAAQPVTLVLTDTHPGNFLVDPAGRAVFVDLEKTLYGAPGIDLAHASLYTSTMWDADCAYPLSQDDVRSFYRHYLDAVGPAAARDLAPWLMPLRRLTWLRTLTFCAKWRVTSKQCGDWPPARLPGPQQSHLQERLLDYFSAETIARIRAEWLGPSPLTFD